MRTVRLFFLTLLICAFLLCACQNKTEQSVNTNQSTDITVADYIADSETTAIRNDTSVLDPIIEQAVCLELGYEQGTALSAEDLDRVAYLAIWKDSVNSLDGISMLHNLEEINIGGGVLSDISELALIPSINCINISNCHITEIPDFSECTNLTQLYLPGNLVEDISPLNNVPSLRYVNLDSNRIDSVASISGIHNLEFLSLMNNCILDYASIGNNEDLITAIELGSQCTYEQCMAVEEKAKEIVSVISGQSEPDKEEYLYRYVIDHMEFDSSSRDSAAYAYQGIFYGTGVCGDYAEVFCMLAGHAGLECYECVSDTHAWNIVKIDGRYYHCDSLWDDTGDDWIYYNKSTEDILEVPDHNYDTSRYPLCP